MSSKTINKRGSIAQPKRASVIPIKAPKTDKFSFWQVFKAIFFGIS
jgi:hypothetical protein